MKKFVYFITFIFLLMFFTVKVNAANATISKDKFTWNGIDKYSECKLVCSNVNLTSGNYTAGSHILTSASGSASFNPATKNGTITCSIVLDKNLSGNDKDETITSKSLTIGTTSKQTTKQTTKPVTTTKSNKSNNANLKKLGIKDQDGASLTFTPDFSSDVFDYIVEVDGSVKKVAFEAEMEDAKANLVLSSNATEELKAGETTKIVLTVTAEDGITKRAYNVNVKKAALNSDATLKNITITEVSNFTFSKDISSYDILINEDVDKLTINAVANSEGTTIKIDGNKNLKNGSIVKIIVTAQDGTTKKEYTFNIIKNVKQTTSKVNNSGSDKDPLVIILLSVVALALVGGIFYTIKS